MREKGSYFAKGSPFPASTAVINLYHPNWHTWRHDSGICPGCSSQNVTQEEIAEKDGEVRGERMTCKTCSAFGYSDFF